MKLHSLLSTTSSLLSQLFVRKREEFVHMPAVPQRLLATHQDGAAVLPHVDSMKSLLLSGANADREKSTLAQGIANHLEASFQFGALGEKDLEAEVVYLGCIDQYSIDELRAWIALCAPSVVIASTEAGNHRMRKLFSHTVVVTTVPYTLEVVETPAGPVVKRMLS